jgi:hypothetical protein
VVSCGKFRLKQQKVWYIKVYLPPRKSKEWKGTSSMSPRKESSLRSPKIWQKPYIRFSPAATFIALVHSELWNSYQHHFTPCRNKHCCFCVCVCSIFGVPWLRYGLHKWGTVLQFLAGIQHSSHLGYLQTGCLTKTVSFLMTPRILSQEWSDRGILLLIRLYRHG